MPVPARLLPRLTVVAVLAAAFALSGCGRKGALDPPPAASVAGEKAAPAAANNDLAVGPHGEMLAPQGEKKRIPLDVLLN